MIYKTFIEIQGRQEELYNERDTKEGNDIDDVMIDVLNALMNLESNKVSVIKVKE